ncbi:hypothetical protein ACFQH6_05860 [Halobacteriaceae archaeon GCM10025711]
MEHTHADVRQSTGVSRWRGVAALAFAVVGTAVLLVWLDGMAASTNGWTAIATGNVGRQLPYDGFNDLWLAVRAVLGLYISVVFVVVAAQLLGTWRQLTAGDEGGD